MNVSDLVIGALVGVLTSLIVWNLWGIHYLQREWQRVFPKEKQPSVKDLLDDSEPTDKH